MKNIIYLFSIFLWACSTSESVTQNVVIDGSLTNSKNDTLYFSTLHFDKITDTDTIIIDNAGKFYYEFKPKSAAFYVLAHKGQNYVRLLIDKDEKIDFKADLQNIPASYQIEGSKGSNMLKKIETRVAQAHLIVDSLTKVVNENKSKPGFDKIFPKLDSLYKNNFNALKADIKHYIEADISSLAAVVGIMQSLNGQSLFNPYDDFNFFCSVSDSVFKYHKENSFAINLYNRAIEMKLKDNERKQIEELLQAGKEAGDIQLIDRYGKNVQLSNLKGKVVLIKFWDSHCQICKQENTILKTLHLKYKSKGFEIFSVSVDVEKSDWLNYLNSNDFNWIHAWLYDEPKDSKFPVTGKYFIEQIPVAHLIGKDGKIIKPNIKSYELEKELEQIFN